MSFFKISTRILRTNDGSPKALRRAEQDTRINPLLGGAEAESFGVGVGREGHTPALRGNPPKGFSGSNQTFLRNSGCNPYSKPQTTQPISPINNPPAKLPRSSGKGNLGCLFGLLIVAALGYLGYKFVPHYVSHFELKDALNEIAVYRAAGTRGSEKQTIQEEVIAKAKELGIQLKREDIKVKQDEEKVYITVTYTVPVELPNQVYNLNFEFTGHN